MHTIKSYPNRKSTRLKNYRYDSFGLYFITICCDQKKAFFGKVEEQEVQLNELGRIVEEEWEKTEVIRENVQLYEYIVMPNHFHGIIQLFDENNEIEYVSSRFESPKNSLGSIIRGFKSATSKRINEWLYADITIKKPEKIWQRNYYDHIIRNEERYKIIRDYIINNPANWKKDRFY